MKITVNGDPLTVQEGATVRALIDELDLSGGPVAVERNGEVVPRAEHAEVRLEDGDDVVEIVHFVGGG